MLCPNCGSYIKDGSRMCPACHAELDRTTIMPKLQGRWCATCGALLAEGASSCSVCGTPVAQIEEPKSFVELRQSHERKLNLPEIGEEEPTPEDSIKMPKIESAIPEVPSSNDVVEIHDHLPRTRALFTALILGAAVLSGIVLYIAKPWNPNAYSISATEPVDSSKAGFPGEKDSLKGQDSKTGKVIDANSANYESLHEAWEKLGSYRKDLTTYEQSFQTNWAADAATRKAEAEMVQELRLKISNVINDISGTENIQDAYVEVQKELLNSGNYLRNEIDLLYKAWQKDLKQDDPSQAEESIMAIVGGKDSLSKLDSYAQEFSSSYQNAEPQKL